VATTLNERAQRLADHLAANAAALRCAVHQVGGARVIDCGVKVEGGLQAGLALARVCLSGQGEVTLVPGSGEALGPLVQVMTDVPVSACMASQYAGWQIEVGRYFAMGSGPMRAAYGKEELFDHIPGREQSPVAVGVLETRKLPEEAVVNYLAEKLGLVPGKITLLVAPPFSIAGSIQVVARSLETALHKLHTLRFDLTKVISGFGTAPLPPIATNDLDAIGRTNDAILYGGCVHLWVQADDAELTAIGPKVPSSSSPDHGAPFAEIFARYNNDFYRVDQSLFSPAVVVFNNLKTGKAHTFGKPAPAVLQRSFFGK
jgi:methenyltetrahydromethanopterin cyclohydrolase